MKWLCFSLGVFASASSGSVTCSARYDRLSSKNGLKSGGSVSIAFPTMMRCALAPQAIVSRGASQAMNAIATQSRVAIPANVNCESCEPRGFDFSQSRFPDAPNPGAFSASAAATSIDLRKLRNICSPLGLIRGAKRALLASVGVVEHETNRQPHKESNPIHDRKSSHQQQARRDRNDRRNRPAWRAEGALTIRFAIAKD